MKAITMILAALSVVAITGCDKGGTPSGDKRVTIAVIPKGTTHTFWKSVHAGAQKAAAEEDVDIIWMGAQQEEDRSQQIDLVRSFISRGVDAMVLAPNDEAALVAPVQAAVARDIPVVIIDSDLNTDQYASFVATDNKEGGRMAARRLGEVMGGAGKAVLLRYAVGSASTNNREEGFLEEMAARYPDIEMVSTNQYAGGTKNTALEASQQLLTNYASDIQGIFCPNESSTFGMLRALEIRGIAGQIHFVGFDASYSLIKGLQDGAIHGLVAQDPFDMGYQGVKTAVAVLNGETVERRIATGLTIITPENLNDPEIQEFIAAEMEQSNP